MRYGTDSNRYHSAKIKTKVVYHALFKVVPGKVDGDSPGVTGWTDGGFSGKLLVGDATGAAFSEKNKLVILTSS